MANERHVGGSPGEGVGEGELGVRGREGETKSEQQSWFQSSSPSCD